MKKLKFALIVSSLMLPMSVMAAPDAHHAHDAKHTMSQQQVMAEGKMFADATLKLMTQGNEFVKLGAQKKDAKLMMQGTKMLKMSYAMHHHAMHGMKAMHGEMKQHLVKGMLGEMKMTPAQTNEIKATMQSLEKALKEYHTAFHVQEALIKTSGTTLVTMGAHMIQMANSAAQTEQSLMGAEMLEMGMSLQTLHGGGEHNDRHQRMVREEIEIHIEK